MNKNLSEQFVDVICRFRGMPLPDSIVHMAKRCLLDYLGATFAGAQMMREKGGELINKLGDTSKSAAVIGFDRKANVHSAALVNGISSHIAELDDGVRFGMIHPGSPVFSALLPLAEKEKCSGADLLYGIVAGYEAEVRLACAIQPSHYSMGYHPTSTCGTIGAAIASAAMLGLSKIQMKDALSTAAISAAGTLKVLEDSSEIKPFNVGRASVNGLLAVSMARAGFRGPDDVLSGDTGFLSIMADKSDLSYLTCGREDFIAIEKIYAKPYAACRHTHPAIEAVIKINSKINICVDDIKDIKIKTYRAVIGKHDHREIFGNASAKMSIPYATAVAFVTGTAGIKEFTSQYVNDGKILSLAKKVMVLADDNLSALVPEKRAAIVEVTTIDGNCYTERVDYPKGEPENPLSDEELREKFVSLASYGNKSDKENKEIVEIVWNIEKDLPRLYQWL